MRYATVTLFFLPLVVASRWGDYDVLSAHNGVFRTLPWTGEEVNRISALHSTGNYHGLMRMIKMKLVETGDLDTVARRKIERFLVEKRPPPVFNGLFDEDEKIEIDALHGDGDVQGVLSIWQRAIGRLPEFLQQNVIGYISSKDEEQH